MANKAIDIIRRGFLGLLGAIRGIAPENERWLSRYDVEVGNYYDVRGQKLFQVLGPDENVLNLVAFGEILGTNEVQIWYARPETGRMTKMHFIRSYEEAAKRN